MDEFKQMLVNMATATVDVGRRDLLSSKNQTKSRAKKDSERHGRAQVEDILSKSQETNCDRVFEIDLHACNLTRIENCQSFSKLRILDLSCNQISLIRGLDKNEELKELKLYSNRIIRVEGLEKQKELSSLQLQDNKISKLDNGLKYLKKLKSLRLDYNEIQSISASEIVSCSKLTYLNICRNRIEDISFVNCLPHLEEFNASHNMLIKIPDLGRCKKLQELDLSCNKISSISWMSTLTEVSIVRLEHNAIKDLSITGTVKSLEELYIGSNKLRNIRKLAARFPSLEVLDVSSNVLSNQEELFRNLQSCTMIRELNICNNPFTTTDSFYHQKCVKSLPGLEVLDGNQVKRPRSSHGKSRPPMRPVTTSQMLSTKQLEDQVAAATQEQESFESLLSSKFSIVYDLLNKLPDKNETTATKESSCSRPGSQEFSSKDSHRPVSRCGNRARIQDAMAFAQQYFDQNYET